MRSCPNALLLCRPAARVESRAPHRSLLRSPQCFVGKRRLEKALALLAADNIGAVVRWHPFELDPTLPRSGTGKLDRYNSKFGAERMAQMLPHMAAVGAAEGITFSYGGLIAATPLSHAFLERALAVGGPALQDRVVEAFFRAYFEGEQNIGDAAVLGALALRAGLPAEDVARLQEPAAGAAAAAEAVAQSAAWRRKHKVSGVPFFVIGGSGRGGGTLSGAQDPGVLAEAIRAAADAASDSGGLA